MIIYELINEHKIKEEMNRVNAPTNNQAVAIMEDDIKIQPKKTNDYRS